MRSGVHDSIEHGQRDSQTNGVGGPQIDDELILGGCLRRHDQRSSSQSWIGVLDPPKSAALEAELGSASDISTVASTSSTRGGQAATACGRMEATASWRSPARRQKTGCNSRSATTSVFSLSRRI